jgi:hypothetical protein
LPATQKQTLRQIRRRNSVGDLSDLGTNKKTPVSRKNITDKVLEALTSPDVLNKIIPECVDLDELFTYLLFVVFNGFFLLMDYFF